MFFFILCFGWFGFRYVVIFEEYIRMGFRDGRENLLLQRYIKVGQKIEGICNEDSSYKEN